MNDWKLVRSDALYAPDPEFVWARLEELVREKLDHIVVEGKTHVWIVSRYIPMESVGVELLRMILRAKDARRDGWKPSRIPVPEHEADKHADTQLIAALEAELLKVRQELALLRSGKPERDVYVVWRGSASDFATDIVPLLTVEQLQELAGELAVKWRERRMAEARASVEHVKYCRTDAEVSHRFWFMFSRHPWNVRWLYEFSSELAAWGLGGVR